MNRIFLLILFLAVFFRFFMLAETPPGLYPDIAVNGTDAISANESGRYEVFYPANNGREGLFINLIALSFKAFGANVVSLRLVGTIIGVLTILGTYLLAKQFFEQRTALLASLFMATSFWHVNFSRIGFRAIMLPFILVWTIYFLHKALVSRKWLPLISSAVIFGLGFYTYIAVRVSPLLILAYVVCTALMLQGKILKRFAVYIKNNFTRYAVFGLVTLIVITPLFLYFRSHPELSGTRTAQVSVFSEEVNKGDLAGTLLKVAEKYALMFNISGDKNWRHNYAGLPQLNPIVGAFFVIGVGLAIWMVRKKHYYQLFFLAWVAVMLLPGVLTEEGAPHALRTIGILPVPFILAAVGAFKIYELINKKFRKIIGYAVLVAIILFDFSLYFILWGKNKAVYSEMTQSYVNIGEFFNSTAAGGNLAVVNAGGVIHEGVPVAAQTVKFITYKKSQVEYLLPENVASVNLAPGDHLAFMAPPDDAIKFLLLSRYPNGIFRTVDLLPGTNSDFTLFEI